MSKQNNRIYRIACLTGLFSAISLRLFFAGANGPIQNEGFPYYKINHVTCSNGLFLADGVVVEEKEKWDAMNNKIQTYIYLYSRDDSTWSWCKPEGVMTDSARNAVTYEAFPRNILAFKEYFVAIIEVGKDPEKTQRIHYSKDGVHWISTGIHVTSLHKIKDKLIAESDLSISVSEDGENWKTYAYKNWDNSYPQYRNTVPVENQTIIVQSYADTLKNDDYSQEEFPYITYDWFKLKGYFADSSYILTDTTSFIALSPDAVHWRFIETPTRPDSNLCLQYARGRCFYVEISKGDYYTNISSDLGKSWIRKKIAVDSSDFENGFFLQNAFMIGTSVYVQAETYYGNEMDGVHYVTLQLISDDGEYFQPDYSEDKAWPWTTPAEISVSKSMKEVNYRFKGLDHGKLIRDISYEQLR